jgi:hypothetical protein
VIGLRSDSVALSARALALESARALACQLDRRAALPLGEQPQAWSRSRSRLTVVPIFGSRSRFWSRRRSRSRLTVVPIFGSRSSLGAGFGSRFWLGAGFDAFLPWLYLLFL